MQRKKWTATRARQMEAQGFMVEEVMLNGDGTITVLERRTFYDGMLRMGLIMNDDEEMLWRQGKTIWAEDSVNRKGKVGRRSIHQHRTEIGDFDSGYRNFGVLGKIERVSGMKIPAGWSGTSEELAEFTGIDMNDLQDLSGVSDLEGKVWNVTI